MPPWKFIDPANTDSERQRQAVREKIDRWWEAFAGKTQDLVDFFHQRQKWDLVEWMHRYLGAIDANLMWEYGPGVAGSGHRLVITSESRRHLRPLVETVLTAAPRIDGWSFHGYRLAEPMDEVKATVQGRTGGDLSETTVTAQRGEHQRIDLHFQSPRFEENDEEALHEAFVAAQSLLGEEVLEKWIANVTAGPPQTGKRSLPLTSLRDTVTALTGSILEQLPDRPYWQREAGGYSMFEIEREPLEDCSGWDDLFVAPSGFPELWQATHGDPDFDSLRYSRHGERFCYLKIDGKDGLDEEYFPDRGSIEDALDQALKPTGLGCVTGGGTGSRYSYIDLALTDVAQSVAIIRGLLQEGNIPRRTWLLFFDRDWEAEWIGMWDDSPPPMLPEFE